MQPVSGPIDLLDHSSSPLQLLDQRDPSSARHARAVAHYSLAIAAAAGLPPGQRELLRRAALLHDIGKITLHERILAGASPLSAEDWKLVRAHPAGGAVLISRLSGDEELAGIVAAHHERVDGRGYPRGLRGAEIPALAGIVAVAEAYDAMTALDSYQPPVSQLAALRRLSKAAGSQFEPRFVELFVGVLAGGDVR